MPLLINSVNSGQNWPKLHSEVVFFPNCVYVFVIHYRITGDESCEI